LTEIGEGKVCIEGYRYILKKSELSDPEKITSFTLTLPHGISARFVRWADWERSDVLAEEVVTRNVAVLAEKGIAVSPFSTVSQEPSAGL